MDDVKTDNKAADGSASNEAIKAVVSDQNNSTALVQEKDQVVLSANNNPEVVIGEDTTLEKFCKKFRVQQDMVRKLNSSIPEDGTIKAGSRIRLIAEDNGK